PRGTIEHIHAERFEFLRQRYRIVERPAAVNAVQRGHAHEQRLVLRPGTTKDFRQFQGKTCASLETSAVLIGPSVGKRGEKLVAEIAVGGMHFEYVESRGERAHCR